MADYEIPAEAVHIVADHCFGEAESRKGFAVDIASVALGDALEYLVDQCGWTPPAVEPQPAQPCVWRVDAMPPDSEIEMLGWLYREDGGMWQVQGESGRWALSGWGGLNKMRAAGFVLTEVVGTQNGGRS